MGKKILIFATKLEAQATLEALKAKSENELYYTFSQGWIFLSKMGLFSAHHTLLQALYHFGNDVDEVINLGFSATLKEDCPLGEIYTISNVGKHSLLPHLDPHSLDLYQQTIPPLTIAPQGKRLLSSEYPIHDKNLKETMKEKWDLVDMEGYAIAYGAIQMRKKTTIYKIISDFALPGGRELIQQQGKELSKKLATFIVDQLEKA